MNILLITNDWKPKTGGISTYLRSLVENLDHKFFIYGPSWIAVSYTHLTLPTRTVV